MREEDIQALYEFLRHGDADHQDWLFQAIKAYFENKPRPEVR